MIERGDVDAALTCLAGTHRLLLDAGVTTWRIDHARVTLVEALQKAWLASEVKKTKGNAIAVVLVGSTIDAGSRPFQDARSYERPSTTSRDLHTPGGWDREWRWSDDRYMITTTQAAVEETLGRHRNGQKS